MAPDVPLVRLVVLNYNGGDLLVRCLEALKKLDWPADRLDLVVVDNASSDGSAAVIAERFASSVRLVRNDVNGGFPANNLALRDLDGVDFVGLVNADSFVEPGWLRPLVAALEADERLGAASARMVFADRFVDVEVASPTFVPGAADQRTLGVRVCGARVDGVDRWRDVQVADGGWGIEHARDGGTFHWTDGRALVRLPVPFPEPAAAEVPTGALCLASGRPASSPVPVTLRCGDATREVTVGHEPVWVELPLGGPARDIVNNAGSVVFDDGYGADRGFQEPDEGQFDEPADVFAWCGGSVLFRPGYLSDVGLFDERFFLYYEDTDLSWRGRSRGWRYRYVPEAVARHVHAASSGEGTWVFQHYVERNRLLMLVKNAPADLARRAVWRHALVTLSYARRDLVRPVLARHRPQLEQVRRRAGSFAGFLRLAPAMLVDRRRIRRRASVGYDQIRSGLTPR